jgi:hypothetical protein
MITFFILSQVVQALSLTKAHVNKKATKVAQGSRVAKLEATNAKLLAELEQTAWRLQKLKLPKILCP